METETAQILVYAIAGVAFVVWLCALQFVINTSKLRKQPHVDLTHSNEWAELPPDNMLIGSVEVGGKPTELADKTASILASPGSSPLGPVRITQKEADRIAFDWAGPSLPGRVPGPVSRRGQIRFSPDGGKTRVDYALEVPAGKGLLIGAVSFLILGIIAICIGVYFIQTYVVEHPNVGVRWQAVQMVQCVHFIWPPFLFAGMYRMLRRSARTGIETMVHNLPHVQV